MLACIEPELPDAETATDREIALTLLAVGKAYYDCMERHEGLVLWVRGLHK